MAPPIRPDRATATSNKIRTRIISRSDTNLQCCIIGCGNKQRNMTYEFSSFPEGDRRVSWLKALGRSDLLNQDDLSSYKICSIHYKRALKAEKRSRIALPSATRRYHRDSLYYVLLKQNVLANGHDLENLREGFYTDYFSIMFCIQDKNYVPNFDDEKENRF